MNNSALGTHMNLRPRLCVVAILVLAVVDIALREPAT
jgi:hypothetical protein